MGYMAVKFDLRVHDVIERIREVGDKAETLYSVYVVGDGQAPRRRVAARSAAQADPTARSLDV